MTLDEAYKLGFIDGLRTFAIWKNDKECVGAYDTTYAEAVDQVEFSWNYTPPSEREDSDEGLSHSSR